MVGELYKTKSCTEIAKIVPHSANSVRDIVKKNRFQKEGYWWSKEKVQFLKDNFETMPYSEMSKRLGLSEGAVRGKLNDLRLVKQIPWTKNEMDYLRKYYGKMSNSEIANHLNRSLNSVGLKARKLNLKASPYHCDEGFFSSIDNPVKSYWLGMMYADGYISINHETGSGTVGLELQKDDQYHIEKFNSAINSNYKIAQRRRKCSISKSNEEHDYAHLRVYSRKMVNDLLALDFVENKTYRPEFPKVSDDLFIHFFRGYFDGNGSVLTHKSGLRMVIYSNNKLFLEHLHSKLLSNYGINSYVYEAGGCYSLSVFKHKDCLRLYNEMYKDSTVHLARKYKKYKDYIETH